MSESELEDALNFLRDAIVLSNGSDWAGGLEILAAIKHGLDTGEASLKQAVGAAEKFLDSAGAAIPSSQIEDAVVAVEAAVTRAQLAKGEADRLVKALENLDTGAQNIVDKLKVVLEKSESP